MREIDALCQARMPAVHHVALPPVGGAISTAVTSQKWQQTSPPQVEADDGAVHLTILLPRTWNGDPNVEAGDTLVYAKTSGGTAYALSDYMDEKIGTVLLWSLASSSIPRRWAVMDGVANASGSGIDYTGFMIQMATSASDAVLPAEATMDAEQAVILFASGFLSGPANLSGTTGEGYAIAQVMPNAFTIQPRDFGILIDKTLIDLAATSITIGTLPASLAQTEDDGAHAHTLTVAEIVGMQPGQDVIYMIPAGNPPTSVAGLHHHDFEIAAHDHGGIVTPNPHDHDLRWKGTTPADHDHAMEGEVEHTHGVPSHDHGLVTGAHSHTVSSFEHVHGIGHEHRQKIASHSHFSGKPARKQLIPIERIY
jgi:hypothetical protein